MVDHFGVLVISNIQGFYSKLNVDIYLIITSNDVKALGVYFFSLIFVFKVVALGNFKYFGIYFKIGYYLRISANKFEYLSVTRIGT